MRGALSRRSNQDGVRWVSSRMEFGESGAHGKSNKGKTKPTVAP